MKKSIKKLHEWMMQDGGEVYLNRDHFPAVIDNEKIN